MLMTTCLECSTCPRNSKLRIKVERLEAGLPETIAGVAVNGGLDISAALWSATQMDVRGEKLP